MKRLTRLLARLVGEPLVRLLALTWRVEVAGGSELRALEGTGQPYVLLCWHEVLLPVMWHHRRRGIAAVVSEAREGQYLARFATGLGYELIRGSSTRGRVRALWGAIRALREGTPVGMTPDGPRGPSRVFKPGAIRAAGLGGARVVPVHAAGRAWRAGSWDRFMIPVPFARIRVAYGRIFTVPPTREHWPGATSMALAQLAEAERLAEWPDGVVTRTA